MLTCFGKVCRVIAICILSVCAAARGETTPDPLTAEATRKTVAEHVARWVGANYFHRDKALADLFEGLAKHGVYPKNASFARLGGVGIFSLSGLKSGSALQPQAAAMGFGQPGGGAGLDAAFRQNPMVTLQADGHYVTYVLSRDGKNFKVEKILEHGTQYSPQEGERLAPKLKIFDASNPQVVTSAKPYRVKRKLAVCEGESDGVRKLVTGFLKKAVLKASDPRLPLGEDDMETLFRALQAKGLFAGSKFDKRFFVTNTGAEARKNGEATITIVVPQIFKSGMMRNGVSLGDDTMQFRWALSGESRPRPEKPLNCGEDEVRRLTQAARDLEWAERKTLPHAGSPFGAAH